MSEINLSDEAKTRLKAMADKAADGERVADEKFLVAVVGITNAAEAIAKEITNLDGLADAAEALGNIGLSGSLGGIADRIDGHLEEIANARAAMQAIKKQVTADKLMRALRLSMMVFAKDMTPDTRVHVEELIAEGEAGGVEDAEGGN